MKLCKIYTEIRRGRKVASREYPPRTLADVKHEIDALNGKTNTLVMLFVDQQTNLAIGGGNQERYNVEVTYGVSDAFYSYCVLSPIAMMKTKSSLWWADKQPHFPLLRSSITGPP